MKTFLVLLLSALSVVGASVTSSFFKNIEADALTLNELNFGTIANGGTATLVLATNISRAVYSGATATIALPTITILTNSYQLTHYGTNTSGGSQVITIPSLLRGEMGTAVSITSFTNNTGAAFRFMAESVAGVWRDANISGDALTLGGSGTSDNWTASGSTNSTLIGQAFADSLQITNGITPLSVGLGKLVRTDPTTGRLSPVTVGSGVTFDGTTLSGSGGGASSTTQTNFILNTVYTNGSQTVLIRATVALTGAVIAGSAAMDLMVDQAGGSTFVLLARSSLATSTLAQTSTNVVSGIVVPLAAYYWTNSSTGVGNSSLIVAGTGQLSTTSGGTGGYGYIQLGLPRGWDGVGTTGTLPATGATSLSVAGSAQFSSTAPTNANYLAYITIVPWDLDTTVEMQANVVMTLNGVDTAEHKYSLGMYSPANSSIKTVVQNAASNYVLFGFTDAAGAASDTEYINAITLTGWSAALTPGRFLEIIMARDGAGDASSQTSTPMFVTIKYKKVTQ